MSDSAGGATGSPPNVAARPHRLTWVCRGVALLVLVLFGLVAVGLGLGESPGRFRLTDQLAMFGIGVLIAGVVLLFTRSRIEADATGITVVNLLSTKRLPWQVVRGIRLDDRSSWAMLDLQDDETVALLAVQTGDGDRAIDAVLGLRSLLAASRRGE